jgi:hypothetical protein
MSPALSVCSTLSYFLIRLFQMAFVPIFCDSFDHYSNLALKWTNVGPQALIQNSQARTGTSCLVMNGPNGPSKSVGELTNWICGHAYLPPFLGQKVMIFYNTNTGDEVIGGIINGDGSFSLYGSNAGIIIATTIGGLISAGSYVYIEYGIVASQTQFTFWVRLNGQAVAPFNPFILTGNFNVHSMNLLIPTGPGGLGGGIHDDLIFGTSTTPSVIQNDFQGAVRIYPLLATANKTPQLWTPLAPPAFSQINQIPPPGDSAYISDGTPGDSSLFQLDFISGQGPVGAYSIQFGQTVMDAKLDSAGSRLIAPNIGGNVGTPVALGSNYGMSTQCYVLNPVTGLPFAPSDFTTTFLGPQVTG